VADEEEVLVCGLFAKEFLEVLEDCVRCESSRLQNVCLITGLGANERGGLKATLEGARDDEVELNIQLVEHVSELEALPFAFFIERTLEVE
jgi:hypothetical protein